MRKSIKSSVFILSTFVVSCVVFCAVACSSMIEDFRNSPKGPAYIVEHYQEIVAKYEKNDAGEYVQTNLGTDDEGNPIPQYELFDTENLRADLDAQTQAVAKLYEGFTALPFSQQKIEDENCVVKIYYNRNEVTVTVGIGDGIWNYVQKKEDDSVAEDKENRTFTGKFGSETALYFDGLFASSGKKGCSLTKYALSNGSQIEILPETFPANDETYTAVWEEGKPAAYKVVHHFEKVSCADNSIENDENYEIRSDLVETETKQGIPETETETQDCAKTVSGFTAKPHSEKEIAANASTVIDIYYVRNPYKITILTDEGLWNYDEWKADKTVTPNTSQESVDQKFGSVIDWSFLNSLKKTGMKLSGLRNEETQEVIARSNLPETIPAKNLNFTAVWVKKSAVSYEVKFMTEKLDSTDSDNVENYVVHSSDTSKTGTPDYPTEAVAKEIPGFTAKDIVQEEIKEDGTTVVYVYYTRNTYKITFDLNGGYWNYSKYKENKASVTPDSAAKEVTGKFEETVDISSIDFSDVGKRANEFVGWRNLSNSISYTTEGLNNLQKFDSSNITIQAQWEKGTGIEYTVKHWFESVNSNDSSNTANYELNGDLTQKELGEEEGEDTEAVAKVVEGFTAKPITQKQIAADGSTVVDVYYARNSSKFIFDANGGNISEGESEITGKYDAVFDYSDTPKASKSGWEFGGWTYKGKLVTNSDLELENQKFGVEDKTFVAYWKSVISINTVTTVGDIVLVKNQTSDNVTCSVTLPAGYESENWTYKWYVDGVYTSDETVFSRTNAILGRGVHTITLKATMNGQNFTARVTATIE